MFVSDEKGEKKFEGWYRLRILGKRKKGRLLIKQNPICMKPICDSSVFTVPKELLASSLTNFIKKCDMLDL